MKSKINLIIVSFLLIFCVAQTAHGALVICGSSGTGVCTLPLLLKQTLHVVDFLIDSATLLAIAYVFYGGVNMVLSRGNSAAYEAAKKTMSSAIQGLLIVLLAYLIVSFAITFLTGGKTLDQILNFIPTK